MKRRNLLAGIVLVLIGATVAALAQPPVAPPTPLPTTPVVPAPAAGTPPPLAAAPAVMPTEARLAQFEQLAAFPHQTQAAVRAVVLGASWMTRMNQAHGRFQYGYNPALRQSLPGDHDLKQARATLALAQAAKFSGDERQSAIASQAVLAMLAATKPDPADANCRVPVHSSIVCNRVGYAAMVALAIYELPQPDAKLIAEAERLCTFLRKQCRTDGSVHYVDGDAADPVQVDPAGMNEYPGTALQAIAVGNRFQPAAWKMEVVQKGVEHYRARFKSRPHPLLAATLTPACYELHEQTRSKAAADTVFELNDWLCGLQIAMNDIRTPQFAGGFRTIVNGQLSDTPSGPETGLLVGSLAIAYQLNRVVPDLAREPRYKAALTDALRYLCALQYLEANTRHFENAFRANTLIGGFHLSPADGNLRIDAAGNALIGILRFLGSGAEK